MTNTVASRLTASQYAALISPIRNDRVRHMNGQSHVEAWDVRRYLIRVFGFCGYDVETIKCECIERIEIPPVGPKGKPRYTIVYSADVRLTVKAPNGTALAVYEDGATGDAVNQPSLGDAHDFAKKTALSQALKRCATNLGDQFGLSLYNKGDMTPVVLRSLVNPTSTSEPVDSANDAPVRGGELDEASTHGKAEMAGPEQGPVQPPQREAPRMPPPQRQQPASSAQRQASTQDKLLKFCGRVASFTTAEQFQAARNSLDATRSAVDCAAVVSPVLQDLAMEVRLYAAGEPLPVSRWVDICEQYLAQTGTTLLKAMAAITHQGPAASQPAGDVAGAA